MVPSNNILNQLHATRPPEDCNHKLSLNTHVMLQALRKLLCMCRFKDSPFVNGFPHIRFYGGAPLIASNGHRIGAM